jgi:hypothetical protein
MPLQRTYSLPSCTLVIEGIGSGQEISILTNFECRFPDSQQTISGGRNLLLVMFEAVNEYVQSLQENLQFEPPIDSNNSNLASSSNGSSISSGSQVLLKSTSTYNHLLQVQATAEDSDRTDIIKIPLSMVQLFDLMESFDLLCLDAQTLPDLVLSLKSEEIKPRRTGSSQPVPILVGAASLAIAVGAAVVFLPPLFKQPEPKPAVDLPQNSRTVVPTTPKPPDSTTPQTTKIPPDSEITDPDLVKEIQDKLTSKIDNAWRNKISFKRDLNYLVTVDTQGAVLSYEPTATTRKALAPNAELKLERLDRELPLDRLKIEQEPTSQTSATSSKPKADKIAKFLVTFSPKRGGKLTVKPVAKPLKVDP